MKRIVNSSEANYVQIIMDLDEKIENYDKALQKLMAERKGLIEVYPKLYGRTYNPNEIVIEEDPVHGIVRATGEESELQPKRKTEPVKNAMSSTGDKRQKWDDKEYAETFKNFDNEWSIKDKIFWAIEWWGGEADKEEVIQVLGDADKTDLTAASITQNFYSMVKRGFLSSPEGHNGKVKIITKLSEAKRKK